MNCKNCNKELPENSISKFCSSGCVVDYAELKRITKINKKTSIQQQEYPIHFGIIKNKIEKRKAYFIHNKTLSGYVFLKSFEDFLLENRLMVVRLEDKEFDLSVIKPSIL